MTRAFPRLATIIALLALLAAPARAADVIFPLGSPIGLAPPAGMVPSKNFLGFEDPEKDAAIFLRTLPATAFPEIEKTVNNAAVKAQGVTIEKREPMTLAVGKGLLIVGRQVAEKKSFRKWVLFATAGEFTAVVTVQVPDQDKTTAYSDDVVRAALTSLAVRDTVPDEERLALLPFKIGQLGGMHVQIVVPGRALILTDAQKDAPKDKIPARLLVAALPGGPSEADERDNFARLAFGDIGDIKDVRITMSEALRINGQAGHQMMADAKDTGTGVDVKVVQWLRFGSGGFLQFIGIAPADGWVDTLTRMRTVRDSLDTQ
jgi:hypothetical protein